MEKRSMVGTLLTCVLVFTLAAATSYGQLVNPGFENGLTGWTTFNFTGCLGTGTGANAPMASGSPHGGLNVFQTAGPWNGGWDASGGYQSIPVSAGATLTFSGFGMDPSGDPMLTSTLGFGEIQIVWKDAGNNTLGTLDSTAINKDPSMYDQWQALSIGGLAPAGTVSALVYAMHVGGPDYAGGSAYFDDMSYVIVPEPSTIALVIAGLSGLLMFARKRHA